MRGYRLHYKNLSIWIILTLQIILIATYFIIPDTVHTPAHEPNLKVAFVKFKTNNQLEHHVAPRAYRTIDDVVQLPQHNTTTLYTDFNASLCYAAGSDLKAMQRSKITNWRCECLPGWHGTDCGQPEIIWRALLRRPRVISGPRKIARRVIYVFAVDRFSLVAAAIRCNELKHAVDLYVLFEQGGRHVQSQLDNGYLKAFGGRILYLRAANANEAWRKAKHQVVRNLHADDVVLIGGNANEVPHADALTFIKLYDNWPQPLIFRYRWSVYGYYWVHPNRTVLRGGASTVAYLNEALGGNCQALHASVGGKGLLIGDLNHFGGWYCEYCLESGDLLDYLIHIKDVNVLKDQQGGKIDAAYLEELIENGVYLNGKTELLRTHRFQERDFAPTYIINNNIAYDWLLINLYAKIDY